MNQNVTRLIIGITGASGAIYGIRMLQALQDSPIETHLVVSKSAHLTIAQETELSLDDVKALADVTYPVSDIAACISSGSYQTLGMVIAPCSMRTMGEIASSTTSTLLTRAADVCLKDRRKLVLMTRETPLHAIHLEQMHKLSLAGAIIAPPVPAFYTKPESIDDIIDHTVGRVLDLFDIDHTLVKRWDGLSVNNR
ncbi:MAG: UbiX family flavin prenyltransferase [Rickettsiales bacterium]|nr:UbiX family flavin prenyltransferase [Rickettsiales bacterium]